MGHPSSHPHLARSLSMARSLLYVLPGRILRASGKQRGSLTMLFSKSSPWSGSVSFQDPTNACRRNHVLGISLVMGNLRRHLIRTANLRTGNVLSSRIKNGTDEIQTLTVRPDLPIRAAILVLEIVAMSRYGFCLRILYSSIQRCAHAASGHQTCSCTEACPSPNACGVHQGISVIA